VVSPFFNQYHASKNILFSIFCFYRSATGVVKIDEAKLEEYGKEGFSHFFGHVCKMSHVQSLSCEDDEIFNPKLSHVVHRRLKTALKDFLWLKKFQALMIRWFLVVDAATGKITGSLDSCKKL
jgi:hypothetical protein